MAPITDEKLGFGKGLYAILETTLGSMTCMLEEEKTPEIILRHKAKSLRLLHSCPDLVQEIRSFKFPGDEDCT